VSVCVYNMVRIWHVEADGTVVEAVSNPSCAQAGVTPSIIASSDAEHSF